MSKKTRRHHSPDQKIDMLRRHLVEKAPVSAVCEEVELQPSVFYTWQRQLFTNGAQVFVESRKRQDGSDREAELLAENERLKARLAKKDEVIAAVTAEMVSLKKEIGEL
jgi:transposase-like protein